MKLVAKLVFAICGLVGLGLIIFLFLPNLNITVCESLQTVMLYSAATSLFCLFFGAYTGFVLEEDLFETQAALKQCNGELRAAAYPVDLHSFGEVAYEGTDQGESIWKRRRTGEGLPTASAARAGNKK